MKKLINSIVEKYPIFFLLLLSSWILLYINDGIISLGDFIFPVKPEIAFYTRFFAWKDFYLLGRSSTIDYVNIIHYFPVFLLNKIGIPINFTQGAFFIYLFSIAAFSVYLFIHEILGNSKYKKLISVISANFYIFNPYILGTKLKGYNMSLYLYAYTPLLLYLFIKYSKQTNYLKNKYIYIIALIFLLSSPANTQPAYITWYLLLIFIYILNLFLFKKFKLTIAYKLITIFIFFLLINFYWILPSIVSGLFTNTLSNVQNTTDFNSIKLDSSNSLYELFRILGIPGWDSTWRNIPYISYFKVYSSKLFIFISIILLITALSALFFKKKLNQLRNDNFWQKYFLIIFLLSIFFITGTSALLPSLKLWLFNKIPILLLYRKPYEKLGFFLIFSFVGLLAISLKHITTWIENFQPKIYHKKVIVVFLVSFLIFINIYGYPFWTKQIFTTMNLPECQLRGINHYPNYYFKIGEYFQKDKIVGRIVGLPVNNSPISSGVENYQWGYAGFDPVYSFVNTGYILLNPLLPFYNNFYNGLSSNKSNLEIYKKNLVNFNILFNVKASILRRDICWQLYNSPDPYKDKKYLDSFLSLNKSFGEIEIYNTPKEYFLPHFYTPQSSIISNQSVDALPGIVSQPDYKLRSAIFFEGQNQTKSESLKVIKSIKSETEKGVATEAAKIAEEVAQCVTADTILRRRRKKSKVKSQKSKVTGGFDPEDFEDVRIDEIEEGDEILTLDEKTGRFIPQRVEKLIGLGRHEIYELMTFTGKTIRTTSNHPYLVLDDQKDMNFLQKDSFEYTERGARKFYFENFAGKSIYSPALKDTVHFTQEGWNHFVAKKRSLNDLITRFFALPRVAAVLTKTRKKPIFEKRIKPDMTVEYWILDEIAEYVLTRVVVCSINHGPKFFLSCAWLGTKEEQGIEANKKELSLSRILSGRRRRLVTSQLFSKLTIPKDRSNVKWIKVGNLKVGKKIATVDGWETIISIRKLNSDKVYDIEVEGTHNFVGNGIVAHNTYVDGNSKLKTQNSNLSGERSNTITNTPILEFKKVNPTKYKVLVHGAKEAFPLVFSESFHEGWKAYLAKPDASSKFKVQSSKLSEYKILDGNEDPTSLKLRGASDQAKLDSLLSSYKILDGNVDDQASKEELAGFIEKGWVTTLGDMRNKEIKHMKYDPGKKSGIFSGAGEKLDYVEKYKIDFVSKNFQDTIQNDNLPVGKFYETWLAQSSPGRSRSATPSRWPNGLLEGGFWRNRNVLQISDENHLMVNGYANSWIIDPNEVCSSNLKLPTSNFCFKNADGSYEMELIVEFWPQRLFYIGLGISGMTLLGCIGYLVYDRFRRKKAPNYKYSRLSGIPSAAGQITNKFQSLNIN